MLVEDELENEANNRELEEGSEDGVHHFAFEAELLKVRERDGDGDNGGGEERLRHALSEIQKPLEIQIHGAVPEENR